VDEYLTDEQEVDRAKRWLRENGAFLVAGVVLGLGGLFGWRQWQSSQLEHNGQASVVWEQMRTAINGDRINEVTETLSMLETDFADTPYLSQARLAIARMHMDRNEPEPAAEQLRVLVRDSSDAQIRTIAELRLGQVLLYQQQYEEALDVLASNDDSAFAGQYNELRGDAYASLGQFEEARVAYEKALESTAEGVVNLQYVGFKLQDVKGKLLDAAPEVESEDPEAAAAIGLDAPADPADSSNASAQDES
jgi:predicted negative regulator of RcsB-dependent stress response